jgi:glyoxylase-like metal-dependent hydrolase (beta-lactamase superfamily II)
MIVEVQAVGPFFKNGFVVGCDATRHAVLIDPGDEVQSLLAFVRDRHLTVDAILLTHAHVDHLTGVPAAKRALDVPIHLHRDDLFLYERAKEQADMFGLRIEPLPPVDVFYAAGDVVPFGGFEARVHHTPGHCPGGVCLEVGQRGDTGTDLFVGDTLFAGSIGRTDLPGGDHAVLIASIRNVLLRFADSTRVHSGHGPSTTIGQERRTNPFLV